MSSNGKTAGLHPADEGSIPSTVHCFVALVVKRPSRDSPKVEAQVRLLAGVLVRCGDRANGEPPALGAGHNGVRFPDLRLLSSECAGSHSTLRRSQIRFDS